MDEASAPKSDCEGMTEFVGFGGQGIRGKRSREFDFPNQDEKANEARRCQSQSALVDAEWPGIFCSTRFRSDLNEAD